MTMKMDIEPKRIVKTAPALSLPIKIRETFSNWYQEGPSKLSIIKYPFYALGLLFALSATPLSMFVDLLTAPIAAICAIFNQRERIRLKQIAWDCLFCGSFGGIGTMIQCLKHLKPQ